MKRIISIFLVLSICMTLAVSAAGEGTLSTDEKARMLNRMSLLSGDGVDFKLNDQLKRCEAVVFIVRLLGNEDYVLENSDEFKHSIFPDVPANQWYAPYVGYCTELGIVAGTNGKFYPDENISEKSFLTLLLGVLGYRSGEDYTWNSVYRAAYEIGIVTGESYMSKVDDNMRYLRSGAANAIFSTLKCKDKNSGNTLISDLVSDGTININDAVLAGLIIDNTLTTINSVSTLDTKRISIVFNEAVEDAEAKNIKIYETSKPSKTLSVEVVSLREEELILKTSEQTADTAYTIEIRGVCDTEGNVAGLLKSSFTGHKSVKVEADFFRVSSVEAVGNNLINVYFTHPVNANAEYPAFYQILEEDASFVRGGFQTMTVKYLTNGKNGVSIYLKDRTFKEGVRYTLMVEGDLVSQYGTRLNEGMDEAVQFYGVSKETDNKDAATGENITVTYIQAIDKSTIEVGFNMEVDRFFAKQFVNYVVYAPDNTTLVVNKAMLIEEGELKGKGIRLGVQTILDKKKEYDLYINFLPDISKKLSIEEKRFKFSGDYPEASDLRILSAEAQNRRLIVAVLDKPLDASMAEFAPYYTIIDTSGNTFSVTPSKVQYDIINRNYTVKLYLPADRQISTNKVYRIRISRAMPYNLGSMSAGDAENIFFGSSKEYENSEIDKAIIIGSDTIKVTFTGEIGEVVPNTSVSNYSLEYNEGGYAVSKIPLSATYINPTTVILRFDKLDESILYRLKAKEIYDYAGFSGTASVGGVDYADVKVGKR